MNINIDFIVTESKAFRLRVKSHKCLTPADLNSLEFVQECLDKDGKVDFTSSYNFFLTDKEINDLCTGLKQITK